MTNNSFFLVFRNSIFVALLVLMIKKVTCFFLSFILLSVGGYAGQIDTLEQQLQTAKDTNRVKILCDLCWEYRFVSAEKALAYGNKALELAQQINYSKGVAQSYNDMGIIFIDQGKYMERSFFEEYFLSDNKYPGQILGIRI